MRRSSAVLLALATCIPTLASVRAVAVEVAEGGRTLIPPAFAVFCAQWPSDCRVSGTSEPMRLNAALWADLREVNRSVNGSIREVSDRLVYGRADVWTIPSGGKGDCEEFALLKRHQLLERGWPSSALLITTARTRQGIGHTVLTVRLADGEYVLDNLSGAIRQPRQTGYRFFARQSRMDPKVWVAIPRSGETAPADEINISER
jgi:predicted transglutaminase-like cysteine proteinase